MIKKDGCRILIASDAVSAYSHWMTSNSLSSNNKCNHVALDFVIFDTTAVERNGFDWPWNLHQY